MKECSICHIKKPLLEFFKSSFCRLGVEPLCKKCKIVIGSERRRQRIANLSPLEKDRLFELKRRQKSKRYASSVEMKKSKAAYGKRNYSNNKIKILARIKVRRAIASGKLIPSPCVLCGSSKVHGHHTDYFKALEVIWLCPSCHQLEHARMGR